MGGNAHRNKIGGADNALQRRLVSGEYRGVVPQVTQYLINCYELLRRLEEDQHCFGDLLEGLKHARV